MITGKQAVALCAALALVWGCGQRQGEKESRVAFERTEELSATDSVPIGQYGIYSPNRAIYSGDSVWIEVSDKSDFKMFVLNDDGRLLAKGISEGKGRGEVLGVTSMHRIGGRTLVYDSNKGVLSKVECRDSTLALAPLADGINLLDDAVMLPDGRVVTMHIVGNYSYAVADTSGDITDTLKYYPPKPDKATDFTNALAYTGRSAFALGGKRFARTCPYDGGIDFFSTDGKLAHLARQEEYPMDYDVINMRQPVPTLSKTTPVGYRSLTASGDVFYALFSMAPASGATDECSEMRSFSSEGKPLCKYTLDHKVSCIAISPDNTRMIAIGGTAGGGTMMYRYTLRR